MEVFGICLLFGFLLMAFWILIFLASAIGAWLSIGGREMFVKKFGERFEMEPWYADEIDSDSSDA